MINLTPNAISAVDKFIKGSATPVVGLRIAISGGGCSGFQYGFTFDEEVKSDDTVVESMGVKLLVDAMSLDLLKDAEVDYQTSLQGESFVIRNPNAASTCGCGKSFTPSDSSGGCANAGY